jgi:pimeloyl-ACP methyl ester carboxylesterase
MRFQHGRTMLELHELKGGRGAGLLLLHELYGCARDWGQIVDQWSGPVYALDFSGHGESEALRGGAYSCELLVADADCALALCEATALAGTGLGAYVALLLSGARPQQVQATLLIPGRGLAGGADFPRFDQMPPLREDDGPRVNGAADPLLRWFEHDVRPSDYARSYAVRARRLLFADNAAERPTWWRAACSAPPSVVVDRDVQHCFAELARGLD